MKIGLKRLVSTTDNSIGNVFNENDLVALPFNIVSVVQSKNKGASTVTDALGISIISVQLLVQSSVMQTNFDF